MDIDANTTEFVTLAEVKAHANITSSDSDGELEMIREAAQDHVESMVGPVLWRTVTDTYTSHGRRVLLRTYPVVSLTSVAFESVEYIGATLDPNLGAVRDLSGYGTLSITYTAGRTDCPEAIRLATLIIAAHLWQTQLGNAPSGALPATDEFGQAPSGMGFAIPARALDLLSPYMLPSGFA